jgi:hypothetical protein
MRVRGALRQGPVKFYFPPVFWFMSRPSLDQIALSPWKAPARACQLNPTCSRCQPPHDYRDPRPRGNLSAHSAVSSAPARSLGGNPKIISATRGIAATATLRKAFSSSVEVMTIVAPCHAGERPGPLSLAKRGRSIAFRTIFKCSEVVVPFRRFISSTIRARQRAWQARAALSFMRLFISCAKSFGYDRLGLVRTRAVN